MLLEAAQAAYLVQSFNEAACLDLVLLARLDFSVADPGSGTTPGSLFGKSCSHVFSRVRPKLRTIGWEPTLCHATLHRQHHSRQLPWKVTLTVLQQGETQT